MSKWYKVEVTQIITVAVEVDDQGGVADARHLALDEIEIHGKVTNVDAVRIEGSEITRAVLLAHYVSEMP